MAIDDLDLHEEDSDEEDSDDDEFESDDDDEEEDESEEDDRATKRPRPTATKRPRYSAAIFLDDAAEVQDDDEDDDEEDEDDEVPEDQNESAEAAAAARDFHRRRAADLPRSFSRGDRILSELEEKYVGRGDDFDGDGDDLDDEGLEGTQDALSLTDQANRHPTPLDPPLWLVRCKPGKEKDIVFQLMRIYLKREKTAKPLHIISAIACDHLKGYIYIEATKQAYVREATNHFKGQLFAYDLKLVPNDERVDVLRVAKKKRTIEKNAWVRVKRGLYKDDIAQIIDYNDATEKLTIKLVPRIDLDQALEQDRRRRLSKEEKEMEDRSKGDAKKRKRFHRPPAQLFDPSDEYAPLFEKDSFENGYLKKQCALTSVQLEDVHPTFQELQKFQKGMGGEDDLDDDDLDSASKAISSFADIKRPTKFSKGDFVKVTEGSLANLEGTIVAVGSDEVTVMPSNVEMDQTVQISIQTLRKIFRTGDHVKVVAGQHMGETGLVLKFEGNVVVVHSDATKQELRLLCHDVEKTTEVSTGQVSLAGFELFDMVQIDHTKAGVIVKIEKDGFRVLTNEDVVRMVKLPEIRRKLQDRNTYAYDSDRRSLSVGTLAKVIDGKFDRRSGTVKHIYRDVLFLQVKNRVENAGVICVRSNQAQIVGESQRDRMGGGMPEQPRRGLPGLTPRGGGGRGARGGGRGRGRGRDPLLYRTIKVRSGPYRGYVGIVKQVTESNVRVELHTKSKLLTLTRAQVSDDGVRQAPSQRGPGMGPVDAPDTGFAPATGFQPNTPISTPFVSTPMHNPSTPYNAPGTPGPDTMRDSVWDPHTASTPAPSAETPNFDSDLSMDSSLRRYEAASPATFVQPSTFSSNDTPSSHLQTPYSGDMPSTYSDAPSTYADQAADTPRMPNTPADWRSSSGSTPLPFPRDSRDSKILAVGCCVTVPPEYTGTGMEGSGVIRRVSDKMCHVSMDDGDREIQVPADKLQPIRPKVADKVILIHGPQLHQIGTLKSAGEDYGVQLGKALDFYFFQPFEVCKYRAVD